jgi:hypothetical protein
MKTKNPITVLLENGIHFSTLTNMSENQIKVLAERFKKEETKEAVQTTQQTGYKTVITPGSKDDLNVNGVNINVDPSKGITMMSQTKPVGTGEVTEKFESKAQQGLFWTRCNNSKGKEKKKWCDMARKFSDETTKKDYKKNPKKKHPEKTVKYEKPSQKESYEQFLEDKIMEMIESNITPRITKGDLKKNISERSERMMLKNPKKMSMFADESGIEMKKMEKPTMGLPIMGNMEENTKEKEKTKEPGIKTPPKRRGNPFKDPNPGVKENPRGGDTKEKERTKTPGIKTPPKRRGNPFKDPNPGVKEKPRGNSKEDVKMTFIDQIKQALK